MNKFVRFIIYALIFLLVIFLGLVLFTQLVYAQEAECILVFNDDDEDGYYDTFDYTDPQGRDVCKAKVVFHQPAEGDPNGAVFTASGEVNGYTADFNGASVYVWRSGSDYSISHSKVWVLEAAPPPTEIPPTDVPPTSTDVPPTGIPPTPEDSPTPTVPGLVPPYPPPPVTPTLIPPVTNVPPTQPGTTPGQPQPTSTPNKVMPQTGAGDNLGLWVAAGLGFGMLALLAGVMRRAR